MRGTAGDRLPKKLVGTAHVFGEHISTDEILPGKYLDRSYSEVGQFAMAGADETFAAKVQPGDIVVAGSNFGCGSSREAAVIALKAAGVTAVIAPSFARIFFRNAINNGLVPVVVEAVTVIDPGDRVEVDLKDRKVRVFTGAADGDSPSLTEGEKAVAEMPILNLQGISLEILEAGGIVEFTRRRMKEKAGIR